VAGLLAIFAPGGIGIREAALALLIAPVLGEHAPAHLIAVATRLWSILAEIVVLALALGVRFTSREGRT
jgi:hypothetical protein